MKQLTIKLNIMKKYTHKTGVVTKGYNSNKEHCFYEETTKREMFLIVEQMSELLKNKNQDWVDKAKAELTLIKLNGFK